MSALLSVVNGANELTISSDGWFPRFLGTATFAGNVAASGSGDFTTGYQVHTFSHSAPILPVMVLEAGKNSRIRNVSNSGSSWTIHVNHSSGADANGFGIESTATVYIFGLPVAPLGTAGVLIYRPDGSLAADLSAPPLAFKRRLTFSATDTSLVTTVASPVILGSNRSGRRRIVAAGAGQSYAYMDAGAWTRSADGLTVIKSWVQDQRLFLDSVPASVTIHRASLAFLV